MFQRIIDVQINEFITIVDEYQNKYAELCNKWKEHATDIVEFYIDANEHILGCERIFIGKYQPFEIYNIFTDFS